MKEIANSRRVVLWIGLIVVLVSRFGDQANSADPQMEFLANPFEYQPGPVDNPLKGLVPYARPTPGRFPHSMEFNYLPLSAIVKSELGYDWRALEDMLDDIASRGNQTVLRFYLEYPNKTNSIPQYLIDGGLTVREWTNTNTAPFPPSTDLTPDYEDENLRKCLRDFIAAFGAKYDGDPRIGYITAGLLGTWGEWHNYPKTEWFASKEVQKEVYEAYQNAFEQTPIQLRYPAGSNDFLYADSTPFSFGYHDDSFAHSTLSTGNPDDNWFFWPKMTAAGLDERWKTAPIGGEIRPEVWGCCFDPEPCTASTQGFAQCRDTTHVTWLMDTGMFREQASDARQSQAMAEVQKMGYDFYVVAAECTNSQLKITIENRGIAPFYHSGWNAIVVFENTDSNKRIETDWSPRGLLPGASSTILVDLPNLPVKNGTRISIDLPNPMSGGKPIQFANAGATESEGLELGGFQ